jgi:hypothetical protein
VNTVRVRSLNASGGILKEATRSFRYAVPTPLLVEIDGSGSVTAGFLGTSQREAGLRYTVTAKPAVGWLFDHWSGSAQAATAAISFIMEEGFALTAHFRVNPFYARRGGYNGLVQGEPVAHATSGFFKATTTQTGTFSGRLMLGGKAYAFSGKFDAAGAAQATIKRGTLLPPLVLALQLDLTGGTDRITGTVSDSSFTAALSADQALPDGSSHFAAGRYTCASRRPSRIHRRPSRLETAMVSSWLGKRGSRASLARLPTTAHSAPPPPSRRAAACRFTSRSWQAPAHSRAAPLSAATAPRSRAPRSGPNPSGQRTATSRWLSRQPSASRERDISRR